MKGVSLATLGTARSDKDGIWKVASDVKLGAAGDKRRTAVLLGFVLFSGNDGGRKGDTVVQEVAVLNINEEGQWGVSYEL